MASRQIVCVDCVPGLERISKMPDIVAVGETVRFVHGKARHSSFMCDSCGVTLDAGQRCAAVTLLSKGERLGAWEAGYIVPDEAPA